jgi:hypothetical protein
VVRDYFTSAPHCSDSYGTAYQITLKNVWLSTKCCKIKSLECANFEAIGSIGHISKTIPVHFAPEAVLSRRDYYNVFMKKYNSINYLSPAYLDSCIVT